jgi:hypothetical protein
MSRAGRVRGTLDIEFLSGLEESVNETEVTMSNAVPETKLVAHERAVADDRSCRCPRPRSRFTVAVAEVSSRSGLISCTRLVSSAGGLLGEN